MRSSRTNPFEAARPTRRAAMGMSALGAIAVLRMPEPEARRTPAVPETVALPDGIQPEGITSGPGTTYYVGSLADGRIVTGDLVTGTRAVLLEGFVGRQLRGLYHDDRTGIVWAAGNVGSEAHVWAVDDTTGVVLLDAVVPGGGFLNDLVVTDSAVWVTDSRVDRLTAIEVDAQGWPTGREPSFLPLLGDWPGYDGTNLAANGIRELSDGRLLLDHSTVGGLYAVDPRGATTTAIPVSGGPGITGGDGIALDGRTAYVVRGSGQQEVSVLRLALVGDRWTARWQGRATDETLDVPSTATLAGGWLWAVNARFGVSDPGSASYWITRLPARP